MPVIGLVILLLLSGSFWPPNRPLPGTKTAQPPAVFSVATRGIAVIITNDNDFDWTDTRITITQANESYCLQAGTITEGDTRGFLLSDFTTGGGKPLYHVDIKPAAVSVIAQGTAGTVLIR